MATITQIQNGLAKYIDEEVLSAMPGWQKWVFGAGATIALNNLPTTMDRLKNHEVVKMLGVIDTQGEVDVAKIYHGVKRQSAKGPITFEIPGMGTMTMSDADVDKIYNSILRAGGAV